MSLLRTQLLLTQEAKMVAAGCLIVCLLLVLRAFSISKIGGRRRFGLKSFLFLSLTIGLIGSIHVVQLQKISQTYDDVAEVNEAITIHDRDYRAANISFQTAFQEYSTTIQDFQPAGDARSDLMAIAEVAGKTLNVGKATIEKFEVLKASARRYQDTLDRAGNTYEFANHNLKEWATEEDTLLLQSSQLIRKMASNEEFAELSGAYIDLAEVFEKLGRMTDSRYAEVEVNLPALEEAIHYVKRANIYLHTVHTHATTLQSFHSPEEILTDIKIYQDGVKEVTDSIRALNEQLGEVKLAHFE